MPFVYSQMHLSNGTRFFNTEYYKNYEFAFKYIEEGKSDEELDENSDGNYSESDGDIDNDNDDLWTLINNHINNHITCYQDDIISVTFKLSLHVMFSIIKLKGYGPPLLYKISSCYVWPPFSLKNILMIPVISSGPLAI